MQMQNHWRFCSSLPIHCRTFTKLPQIISHCHRSVAGPSAVGIGGDYNGVSQFPPGLQDVAGYPRLFQALLEDEVTSHT